MRQPQIGRSYSQRTINHELILSRVYKECLQIDKEKTTQSKMSKGYEMAICRKGI